VICAVHQEDDAVDGRQVVLPDPASWNTEATNTAPSKRDLQRQENYTQKREPPPHYDPLEAVKTFWGGTGQGRKPGSSESQLLSFQKRASAAKADF